MLAMVRAFFLVFHTCLLFSCIGGSTIHLLAVQTTLDSFPLQATFIKIQDTIHYNPYPKPNS